MQIDRANEIERQKQGTRREPEEDEKEQRFQLETQSRKQKIFETLIVSNFSSDEYGSETLFQT